MPKSISKAKQIISFVRYQLDEIEKEVDWYAEYSELQKQVDLNPGAKNVFWSKIMLPKYMNHGHWPKRSNMVNRVNDIRRLMMDIKREVHDYE